MKKNIFFGYREWCYQNIELIFIFFFSFSVTNPQDPRFKLIYWLLPRKVFFPRRISATCFSLNMIFSYIWETTVRFNKMPNFSIFAPLQLLYKARNELWLLYIMWLEIIYRLRSFIATQHNSVVCKRPQYYLKYLRKWLEFLTIDHRLDMFLQSCPSFRSPHRKWKYTDHCIRTPSLCMS